MNWRKMIEVPEKLEIRKIESFYHYLQNYNLNINFKCTLLFSKYIRKNLSPHATRA